MIEKKLTVIHAVKTRTGIMVQCPRCQFRRTFGTEQGAMTTITEHMLYKHSVRPVWQPVMGVTK